ncbi:MAG: CHAT domain-containing protein, partial [Candidatus Kentron sp. G]
QDSSLTHSTLQLRATMSAIRHPCLIMGQCPSNFEGRNTQIRNRKIPLALQELREMDARLQGFVGAQLDSTLSEKVRRQWLESRSNFQDVVFTLALQGFMPEKLRHDAVVLAADVLLRWQRLAGESEALIAHLARVSPDPKIRELAGTLAKARAEWSRQVNMPEPNPKAIAIARNKVEEQEVQLAGLSREFKDQRTNRTLEWRQVRDALPTGSALLSLRGFQRFDLKTGKPREPHWLALLIPAGAKDESAIILKDIGPIAAVAEQFARLRKAEERKIACQFMTRRAARRLYALLFGELDGEFFKYGTLYLAPDGMLDLVAFSRLVLPDGCYWIEREWLRQIRAGRDLVGWGERSEPQHEIPASTVGVRSSPQPTALVAFGAIDYGEFPDAASASRSNVPVFSGGKHSATGGSDLEPLTSTTQTTPTTTSPPVFSEIPGDLNQRLREAREIFSPLPATRPEVAAIAEMYEELTNHPAKVYTGREASDYRLRNLPEVPRVLHLATHGFFLSEKAERTDRPMTLGGLALAGANRGMAGETGPDGEDGILYALVLRLALFRG